MSLQRPKRFEKLKGGLLLSTIGVVLLCVCSKDRSLSVTMAVAAQTEKLPDVLVIGGTGLMGAPTVRRLQEQGHRVVVLSRGHDQGIGTSGRRPDLPQCEMIQCDRTEKGALLAELLKENSPRIVVDFAAMKPADIEDVVAAHRKKTLQHYIFISTNMVYPGGPESFDVSGRVPLITEEQADLDAKDVPDTYGGRKLQCEVLLKEASASDGFSFTTLRPPAVVGPGCDNRHERLQRAASRMPLLPPRDGPQTAAAAHGKSFRVAYSGDVAAAVAAVVLKGPKDLSGEAFNIASEESVTMDEYVKEMADILGTEKPSLPPPEEDASIWNYEKQGNVGIQKAKEKLEFRPTPLKVWLTETVKWHQSLLQA